MALLDPLLIYYWVETCILILIFSTLGMQKLNLPNLDVKIRKTLGKYYILDVIRKKYVQLLPEEWVRQHFIHYLLRELHYPPTLIRMEHPLMYSTKKKRADILVYNSEGKPYMIVECKAASIPLTQKVVEQVTHYNLQLKARYLVITNGMKHICCKMDYEAKKAIALSDIPPFEENMN